MEPETNKSDYTRALNLLTRYLAMRDHSRFELQTKLGKRFAAEFHGAIGELVARASPDAVRHELSE